MTIIFATIGIISFVAISLRFALRISSKEPATYRAE